MAKNNPGRVVRRPPATTVEARENELISLAYDQAEEQLRNGTASSQTLSLFLKEGSVRSQVELEKLRAENLLTEARVQALKSQEDLNQVTAEALDAFRGYQGSV